MNHVERPQSERGGGSGSLRPAADMEHAGPKKETPRPVWFFVGIIFLVYGAIIGVTGVIEFSHPPDTVLAQLHPAIWWGATIFVIGAFLATYHGRQRK